MKRITGLLFVFFNMVACSQNGQTNMDWENLNKYAKANKELPAKLPGEHRIVFMGNSITEFWKEIDSSFFVNKPYINRGISGQTTPQMLLRFPHDVVALKPDVVVLLAGINDIAQNTGPISLEEILANIISMAKLAEKNKIRVVLSSVLPANTLPWRPDIQPADKIIKLNAMIRAYANSNDLVYIDYYSSLVDDKKGLGRQFSEDGVHPGLAGYKVMEPLAERAIESALKKNFK